MKLNQTPLGKQVSEPDTMTLALHKLSPTVGPEHVTTDGPHVRKTNGVQQGGFYISWRATGTREKVTVLHTVLSTRAGSAAHSPGDWSGQPRDLKPNCPEAGQQQHPPRNLTC